MYQFRVFVSYAREDYDLAEKLVKKLKDAGLLPFWDKDVCIGSAFSEEIKGLIAHSHIFMPLITNNSDNSTWVHIEIGFAIAMKIPIVPIKIENQHTKPNEMIALLQAIIVDAEFQNIHEKLKEVNLERLVIPLPSRPTSLYDSAEWPEKRTELLVKYTDRELRVGNYGKIRQKALLSSFYIPSTNLTKETWIELDGDKPRSEYYHYLLSEERRVLGQHVEREGCKLIIDPTIKSHYCGDSAVKFRLEKLIEFLESMQDDKDDKVKVVISRSARRNNLTIVGDWFLAESRIPTPQGYRNTTFNFHAPTVLKYIKQFDDEFSKIYEENQKDKKYSSSREYVINVILLEGIELGLKIKFGSAGLALIPEIRSLQDPAVLHNIKEALKIANSLEEIRPLCREPPTNH